MEDDEQSKLLTSLQRAHERTSELEIEVAELHYRRAAAARETRIALEGSAHRERVSTLCAMIALSNDDRPRQVELLRDLVYTIVGQSKDNPQLLNNEWREPM